MATILIDGDFFEKLYWSEFLSKEFPTYEKYWASKIVPLTNRPNNIHFKKSTELTSDDFTSDEICKAQLHYTTLRHLARAFELKRYLNSKEQTIFDTDILAEGLFHIVGAQDVAFEFLERMHLPGHYDPWAPMKSVSSNKQPASKEAVKKWRKNNNDPLLDIRNYRNHLTHGRLSPIKKFPPKILIPKIGFENKYLDWRLITDWNHSFDTNSIDDFDSLENILDYAWQETIKYLESEWQKII